MVSDPAKIRNTWFVAALVVVALIIGGNHSHGQNPSTSKKWILPDFETKDPTYCLFDFPGKDESKSTVLVVLDGSKLYVDRNSNRDLTETDDLIQTTRKSEFSDRDFLFEIGDVNIDGVTHSSFQITAQPLENYVHSDDEIKEIIKKNPNAKCVFFSVEVQHPKLKGDRKNQRIIALSSLRDLNGFLRFGPSIDSAPTINLCGPLEVRISEKPRLRPGMNVEFYSELGFAGKGNGTFTSVGYENCVPENAWPKIALTFEDEKGIAQTVHSDLKQRC